MSASETPSESGQKHEEWDTAWDPSLGPTKPAWAHVVWIFCHSFVGVLDFFFFRSKFNGREHFPKEGPFLLISNHVSMFDPVWSAWPIPRRDVHFMAASTLFRIPILGPLIRQLGAFPKAKFVKDAGAAKEMVEICRRGGVVVMFPEGHRTWDGRTEPVLPGLGRMLKRTNYRVVICRNKTGHLFQPRWAWYPRYVPIHLEYEGPLEFDPSLSVEEINEKVSELIRINPDEVPVPKGSRGWRLAHGLHHFLWACPNCLEEEGMRLDPENGDRIFCRACNATWDVDLGCNLVPVSGPAKPIKVYEAGDHIRASITEDDLQHGEDNKGRRILLQCPEALITRRNRKTKEDEVIAQGEALLVEGAIIIRDGAGQVTWEIEPDALGAVSVDLGTNVWLRLVSRELLALKLEDNSPVKWVHFASRMLGRHRS